MQARQGEVHEREVSAQQTELVGQKSELERTLETLYNKEVALDTMRAQNDNAQKQLADLHNTHYRTTLEAKQAAERREAMQQELELVRGEMNKVEGDLKSLRGRMNARDKEEAERQKEARKREEEGERLTREVEALRDELEGKEMVSLNSLLAHKLEADETCRRSR